jgi:hypothetical protein
MRFYLAATLLASLPWVGMAYTLCLDHWERDLG